MENQKEFMEYLAEKLTFKVMNDWYLLKKKDISNYKGGEYLQRLKILISEGNIS